MQRFRTGAASATDKPRDTARTSLSALVVVAGVTATVTCRTRERRPGHVVGHALPDVARTRGVGVPEGGPRCWAPRASTVPGRAASIASPSPPGTRTHLQDPRALHRLVHYTYDCGPGRSSEQIKRVGGCAQPRDLRKQPRLSTLPGERVAQVRVMGGDREPGPLPSLRCNLQRGRPAGRFRRTQAVRPPARASTDRNVVAGTRPLHEDRRLTKQDGARRDPGRRRDRPRARTAHRHALASPASALGVHREHRTRAAQRTRAQRHRPLGRGRTVGLGRRPSPLPPPIICCTIQVSSRLHTCIRAQTITLAALVVQRLVCRGSVRSR